jgi:hypothetical protein
LKLSDSGYAKLAKRFRGELLKAAQERRTVTYGYLMKRFSISRGRVISGLLGEVDAMESRKGSPGFAALVVRKDTGFPGGGFFCDPGLPVALQRGSERSTDPKLSLREMAYVRGRQRFIWSFYSKSKAI